MGPTQTVETEIYADHTQFYLVDPEADLSGDVWDGAGLERRLGVSHGVVAVGTVGHTYVPVALELWTEEPPLDLGAWDHVVEATIETRSGLLALQSLDESEHAPLAVEPGTFRVRSSVAGLDAADELDGGDRYRLQVWAAPAAGPVVRKCWPAWDPSGVVASPTTPTGRILVGAEAFDARDRMSVLASRDVAHLYRDAQGTLWESSATRGAGTLQLEVLDHAEAERRYGPADGWSTVSLAMPSLGEMLRNIADTLRYNRGWRPEPDPPDPVLEDGRRVYVGNTAVNRLGSMTWVAAAGGDNLHVDGDGSYWELRRRAGHREKQRLVQLTREEAETKYGELG